MGSSPVGTKNTNILKVRHYTIAFYGPSMLVLPEFAGFCDHKTPIRDDNAYLKSPVEMA